MSKILTLLVLCLGVAACGGTDNRPVVVQPPANSTVVVPPSGQPIICPTGSVRC
ncbi:MAG: hypothetical protein ACREFQ_03535 [Stellaceae bacterium]